MPCASGPGREARILFGNLPFLIIQRYNRPRLVRLLAMQQRRSAKQNQQPS